MKTYPKYKDSGISWIGQIPEQWDVKKLKNCVSLIRQKTSEKLQYIGLENIESYSGRILDNGSIEPESNSSYFEKGDILFNKLRPYLTKCVIPDFNGICSSELLVFRTKENNKFFQYTLLSPKFINVVDTSTYGSKMPRANWNFIGNCSIPLPPLAEQTAIATFLDEKTAKIDSIIAAKEKELDLLDEYKQSIIADAVTKGINPNVKMKDSGIKWLPKIPEHWDVIKAKNLFKKEQRPILEGDDIITCFRDGEVTLRKNRRTTGFTEATDFSHYQHICKGDLVIHQMDAFAGASGVSDSDGMGTPVLNVCTPKTNKTSNYYYAHIVRLMGKNGFILSLYKGIRERSSDFRFDTFGNQWLPVPPLSEQEEIVTYINTKTDAIAKMRTGIEKQIAALKEYKQSLISDVVTGKVDVRN